MTVFGKYTKQNKKHFFEKSPETYWVFRYPTSDEEAYMERFMRGRPTKTEVWTAELALTFEETNLGIEEEGDVPYMDKDMDIGAKKILIGKMPHELLMELARSLGEFADGWGVAENDKE
jgi:hypothetical protein